MKHEISLAEFVDLKQQDSRYWFTSREYFELVPNASIGAFHQSVHVLSKQKRIFHVCKNFYLIIPLEYKNSGILPSSWYIDALMKHLGFDYYVSLLTGASFLGFAHQQPQQFQVLVNKQRQLSLSHRTNINCIVKKNINPTLIMSQKTSTGYFNIAKKESLVFDIVQYQHLCGYLNNVGTILYEIGSELDPKLLAEFAPQYPKTVTQRLGYLLDFVGHQNKTDELQNIISQQQLPYAKLSPTYAKTELKHEKWRIIINDEVDIDL